MSALKKISGLYYTYLQVSNLYLKGFTNFVELTFKTEKKEPENKPYRVYMIENGKKTLAINRYYWINTVPQQYSEDILHEQVLGNKAITLSVNLLLGKLYDMKYVRTINFILEEEGIENPTRLWESGNINLISKKIDLPQMSVLHKFTDGDLVSQVILDWPKDADFNNNSKGINLLLEVIAYNSMQSIKSYQIGSVTYTNVITIPDVAKEGSYILKTSIIDLQGDVILEDVYHHVHKYKPLDLFIKTENGIYQSKDVFIKTDSGIKKIKGLATNL